MEPRGYRQRVQSINSVEEDQISAETLTNLNKDLPISLKEWQSHLIQPIGLK